MMRAYIQRPSVTTHIKVCLLFCLALKGHGRRWQTSAQPQSIPYAVHQKSHQTLGVLPFSYVHASSVPLRADSNFNPLKTIARLLSVFNSGIAFKPASPVGRFPVHRPILGTTSSAAIHHRVSLPRMISQSREVAHSEKFSVAPMMKYTDKHLRFLLRLLSHRAVLYTEMVTAPALANAPNVDKYLSYNDPEEHPVVLQLGGSSVENMRVAAAKAAKYGYDDINLNCGCPSDKVSGAGSFGAVLMRDPQRVADLCLAISEEIGKPATVKCRIGVDDDDSFEQLCNFVDVVSSRGGVEHFIIHARTAILGGLSPKQNREIPPLKYHYVYDLVEKFPHLRFTLNGGVLTYEDILKHLEHGAHGVMLGRAITATPWMMSTVDTMIYGAERNPAQSRRQVLREYAKYCDDQLSRLEDPSDASALRNKILTHAMSLFHGEPDGKRFRNQLDKLMRAKDLGLSTVEICEKAASVLNPEILDLAPGEQFDPYAALQQGGGLKI